MKSVASATIIVMALLVTTTNGSLLRDSKGKLLLKAKATTKATAKATTKAQGVHVRGHTGATVVDTWTANTAAWNDRIYRVTDFGEFTTSNYQYFVKTSVTRRGHSIPLKSTFAARYVVITETAMHSSITNSHACPSSWKTAAAGSGFVKHDLYGYSSGFATFGTYCSYVDVSAGSQIIVPAGGEKKFIFVKSLEHVECSNQFDICKSDLYNTQPSPAIPSRSRVATLGTVVDTWTANTAAWNDRIYRVTDFGEFTTSNYQYFVKTSVTRRGHSIPLKSTFAARYVVITETAMHSSITNSHACPSSWKTAAAGSGFVKHDLYGYSSGFATFGTYCSYVDVSAGSQIIVPAGGEKKFIFVKSLECSIKFDMCKLGTPTNCIRVNIPRLVCEYLQPHDWCRQHGACTPADDMYDIDN